jgi:hypothetical protein
LQVDLAAVVPRAERRGAEALLAGHLGGLAYRAKAIKAQMALGWLVMFLHLAEVAQGLLDLLVLFILLETADLELRQALLATTLHTLVVPVAVVEMAFHPEYQGLAVVELVADQPTMCQQGPLKQGLVIAVAVAVVGPLAELMERLAAPVLLLSVIPATSNTLRAAPFHARVTM